MAGEKAPVPQIEQLAISNMEKLILNTYPGRGIVMGLSKQGDQAIQVYWIMGRSSGSRNRVFIREGDIVRTNFFIDKGEDPTNVIYTAMRIVGERHLVSNGNQTDSVAEVIKKGGIFEGGLAERTYEPDKPIFTSRITGMYAPTLRPEAPFALSIIRKDAKDLSGTSDPIRTLETYMSEKGIGQCIHTYKEDGALPPAFVGPSYPVMLEGSVDQIAQTYWNLLNEANKVALVAKGVSLETGEANYSIINKLSK